MDCEILPMNLEHFVLLEQELTSQFDSFWNPSVLKEELNNSNSHYFIAILNNKIVGFAGIWKAVDICHITNIVVRKDCRRQGIGSKLLEKLIQEAKLEHADSLTLEVSSKNIIAQNMYEKYNFNILGKRKKYYNNTEDAIIMTLYFD